MTDERCRRLIDLLADKDVHDRTCLSGYFFRRFKVRS